ncbi:Glucose/arabinose dehydrogenase, beta-propeller fold [Fodinibius salinus]|uniref:Glucose/arabinose dehydrogenase, beta-propeller fold n=1 Tax=Fodinibius salinus TaxID=860790 RepID=A0A5D3YMN8_9BACT|nr:PQQ-dependent sugar dehydrogenase [Fodinibius salinus]TYP95170.1 Glucose/arabinose dehydrogenase, beta-propeller fold [Fodinibius salinus]
MDILKYCCLLFLAFTIGCNSGINQETKLNFEKDDGGITLPDGFQAIVVAKNIGAGRHITTAPNGDIYMALSELHNGNGIAALRDNDEDGKAETVKYFGNQTGTGIQVHSGYLYFGSDTSIVRYQMTDGKLIPEADPETVVGGFATQQQHAVKPFTFDRSGNIYVNIGAPSNACQQQMRTPGSAGMDPCPQLKNHGGIWQFSATETGQTFQKDGQRYATGIRNSVALDWNLNVNELYVAQHGRDQLHSLWSDYYTTKENAEQPAEELFRVNKGDNFGWPYTYYNWKKEQKMKAPEYGGDGETPAEKGKYENPIMAFSGHWAPNDLVFYNGSQFSGKYKNGAFIAFHGSWNRAPEPQQGYKVVFVPFDGPTPSGDYKEFADGFAGKDSLQSPRKAQYRPMGIAQYKDGSLLISDSQEGKIWRIVYTGN